MIVLSIPDYAFSPFGQTVDNNKTSEDLDYYNEVNERIAQENGAKYVQITDITRNGIVGTDLVASDGLHPSNKAYKLFVSRILKVLNKT